MGSNLNRAIAASALLGAIFASQTAPAHEFWIDPVEFTPKVGTTVPIVFRIGQNFEGGTYPYVRGLDRKFPITDSRGDRTIKALDGDDPAAEVKFTHPGLTIIAHQRAPEIVVFETLASFEENLIYEGLDRLVEQHKSSGRPSANIRDAYARFAKALISVGPTTASASDKAIGLTLELIAEKNPYALKPDEKLPLQLRHEGQPIAGVLIKCFDRKAPSTPRSMRTNTEGRVSFDLPVSGEYLISAVHMVAARPQDNADWASLWATLSFARP